ncbi:hypothetical protein ACIQKB_05295 [Streptomyces sp. NPDC092046]|uniref:hypothetical protein n=1 Tax=Streptomyces sp. NPDC092046 TaxID=3366009 RepID=UPI00381D3470
MTDHVTTAVTTLLAATEQQGPGNTLRVVLLVSIVGGALLAWFLLRGYGDKGDGAERDERAESPKSPESPESPENVKIVENGVTEKDARDANA